MFYSFKHDCILNCFYYIERCTQISRLLDNKMLLYCIVLYCIVSYRIVSYRIVSYRVVSCRVVSCCVVLYCIVLYCKLSLFIIDPVGPMIQQH